MKPSERIEELLKANPKRFKDAPVWIYAIMDYLDEQAEANK